MTKARDFWSRRRAAVAAEEEAEKVSVPTERDAAEAARHEGLSDAELLQELELPEPETLKAGDDFTVFLSRSVPDRLRRRALRALWRSNPTLANLDGLVDYDADFTDKATVVPNLKTAYTVGRGMLAHIERMERAAAATTDAEPATAPAENDDASVPDVNPAQAPSTYVEADVEADDDTVDAAAPAPRRMVFTYESEDT